MNTDLKINVQEVYSTFQGEVNAFGIGAPAIFVRLGGCHLRCYLKILGVLCDTPNALEKGSGKNMLITELVEQVRSISSKTGCNLVCLTGGDPLWRDKEQVTQLLTQLTELHLCVSVETSGTLDWTRYLGISPLISWVVDYKLKSAGVKNSNLPLKLLGNYYHRFEGNFGECPLGINDHVKFIVYDEEDYKEFINIFWELDMYAAAYKFKIAVGVYWNGKVSSTQLYKLLEKDSILGRVVMNFQTHKYILHAEMTDLCVTSDNITATQI